MFAASTSRLREGVRRCAVLSLKTTTPSLGAAAANAVEGGPGKTPFTQNYD